MDQEDRPFQQLDFCLSPYPNNQSDIEPISCGLNPYQSEIFCDIDYWFRFKRISNPIVYTWYLKINYCYDFW